MKVGYRWLQDYITFPWDVEELADRLTAIGTAVDGIAPVFKTFTGVVAARIVSVTPHPDRPTLHVLRLDHGGRESVVVAGAPNCRVGILVPLARPGAALPSMEKPLGARTFAGVESEGMCCSERDLGLTDDHTGLMELREEDIAPGADLWVALGLDEVSVSFELTPNRPDCLSVMGIAREIGALVGSRLRRPESFPVESKEAAADHLEIEIEDAAGCPRYAGRLVRGGRIGPSPFWLKRRLIGAGMRPINNAVDITNYVMLETGQPLHAFDWTKFASGRVVVRTAKAGEEFTTLDGETRRLPADAVMITDGKRNLAIGGVMGGLDSEVDDTTTDFLLESASFTAARIRRTRVRLGLATESALRFEKGVDPNGVVYALDRAAALFADLTGGTVLAGAVDSYENPVDPVKLSLDPERVNRLLGTNMSSPTMIDFLSQLEFGVMPGKTVAVAVPTFRPDVTREVDLIEEIGRLYGLEKIPVNRRAAGPLLTRRSPRLDSEERVRGLLEGMGFSEIVCNSLIDPDQVLAATAKPVVLRNPLSSELSVLRADLFGSLMLVIAHNRNRRVDSVAIYEIGKVFAQESGEEPYSESRCLVLGLCGEIPEAGWGAVKRAYDFFDLKGALGGLLDALGQAFTLSAADSKPYKPGAGFEIRIAEERVGTAGQIDPAVAQRFGLKEPIWSAALSLDGIMPPSGKIRRFRPLPRYPAVYRDLAVVVGVNVPAGDLEAAIAEAGGEMVESVRLFDRYEGEPIADGMLSLAFSVTYRVPDRTLTDSEVDRAHAAIMNALATRFDATLRA